MTAHCGMCWVWSAGASVTNFFWLKKNALEINRCRIKSTVTNISSFLFLKLLLNFLKHRFTNRCFSVYRTQEMPRTSRRSVSTIGWFSSTSCAGHFQQDYTSGPHAGQKKNSSTVRSELFYLLVCVDQGGANYGSWARCVMLGFLIRPAKSNDKVR